MHEIQVHPVTTENQFHCTSLYIEPHNVFACHCRASAAQRDDLTASGAQVPDLVVTATSDENFKASGGAETSATFKTAE